MNRWILLCFVIVIVIGFGLIIWFMNPDSRGYSVIADSVEDFPSSYLPISEWDLIQMPSLITAMNKTGMAVTISKDDWQEIYDYLESEDEIVEFYGDFYHIRLLRSS